MIFTMPLISTPYVLLTLFLSTLGTTCNNYTVPIGISTYLPFPANLTMPVYSTTNVAILGMPVGVVNCSTDLGAMNSTTTNAIIDGMFHLATTTHLAPKRRASIWALGSQDEQYYTDQIYYCNYHERYDHVFSVAEFRLVETVLDGHCGTLGGWVMFPQWKVLIGRDPAMGDGTVRSECGLWDFEL